MKGLGTVTIKTSRLILRRFVIEDAQAMYDNWASDDKTTAHLSWDKHKDINVTKAYLKSQVDQYDDGFFFQWGVMVKNDNTLIGSISVVDKDVKNKTCEIGYCYGSKYWNQGYGSEALRGVIEFLLNDVGFALVSAKHLDTNPSSGRVMQKAGMKQDAFLRNRVIDKVSGKRANYYIYSVEKDEL